MTRDDDPMYGVLHPAGTPLNLDVPDERAL